MEFQQVVQRICELLRLPELACDDQGTYAVVFDGGVEIEFLQLGGSHVLFRYQVVELTTDVRERTDSARLLLKQNLARLRQQHSCLSLDPANRIWLSRIEPLQALTPNAIDSLLEEFVNEAEWWSQTSQPSTPSSLPFTMLRP